MEAAEDFMLNLECRDHGELCPGLDLEGLILQLLLAARGRQVDDHRGTTGRLHAQRQNDAHTRVVRVGKVLSAA